MGPPVKIVSLAPLYHSVWALTSSPRLVEWQIFSEQDEHGLHQSQRIDPLRCISVDVAHVEKRFQSYVCGMKRLYNGQLCVVVGNSVIVVIPPDPKSPLFPTPNNPEPTSISVSWLCFSSYSPVPLSFFFVSFFSPPFSFYFSQL